MFVSSGNYAKYTNEKAIYIYIDIFKSLIPVWQPSPCLQFEQYFPLAFLQREQQSASWEHMLLQMDTLETADIIRNMRSAVYGNTWCCSWEP